MSWAMATIGGIMRMAREMPPGMTVSPTGWKMPCLRGTSMSVASPATADRDGGDDEVGAWQHLRRSMVAVIGNSAPLAQASCRRACRRHRGSRRRCRPAPAPSVFFAGQDDVGHQPLREDGAAGADQHHLMAGHLRPFLQRRRIRVLLANREKNLQLHDRFCSFCGHRRIIACGPATTV